MTIKLQAIIYPEMIFHPFTTHHMDGNSIRWKEFHLMNQYGGEKKNPTEINIACLHYIGVLGYHVHTISVFVCAWNSRMVLWIRKYDQNMNPQSSERVKYRVWVNCPSKWLIVRTKSEFIWFRTEWRWGQKLNNNSVLCGWGSFQKLSLLLIKMATRTTVFF